MTSLLPYIEHDNFISLENRGSSYLVTMKSLIIDGKYYDITGRVRCDASIYMLEVPKPVDPSFKDSALYVDRYLSIGKNQQEDEDGEQ
jgi:hypothetical protein